MLGEDLVEREEIVRRYLHEVTTWVAAPNELDSADRERSQGAPRPPSRDGEARSPGVRHRVAAIGSEIAPLGGEREVHELEREVQESGREVQELSLSIGTISIVIEEPEQIAPAQPPSPRVDRAPAQPVSEPTRLSRYYLEPW
jgi:hypothetical protein